MGSNPKNTVTYIGNAPYDLGVVTPLASLAQQVEEAARLMKVNTCVAVSDFDNDVEVALEMIRAEKVQLLATRGHAVHILRKKASIPILSFGYSPESFLETLLPYQNSGMRVGHICFPEQDVTFMRIARLLGLEGYRLEVTDRNDMDKALREATEKNISLLIGGYGLMMKARGYGFKTLPLVSGYKEEVHRTLTEAKYIIAMNDIHLHRQIFINTVLNINPNIIVVVDRQYTIRYANDSATKAFPSIRGDMGGLPLKTLFPDQDFEQLFARRNEANAVTILTDTMRREFLFTAVNITLSDGFNGFVLSLNNVADIRKNERQVRQNMYRKRKISLFSFDDIVGESAVMRKTKKRGARYAGSDASVLLIGDSGTGKEMFAQAIHGESRRRDCPFLSINCASIPEQLLESELFGYEEGAFTGARRGGKAGIFELAHGGTLFLDEIGDMPLDLQVKLLRILQEKVTMRLGGTCVVPVDVRIICATNRNILHMVKEGMFRTDLFYRINTLILKIPSLEERKEDIAPIAEAHLAALNSKHKTGLRISEAALLKLTKNVWKGNVRELLHVIDRAYVLCHGQSIHERDVVFDSDIFTGVHGVKPASPDTDEYGRIKSALMAHRYNKLKTAAVLGMSRSTLWRKMKAHGL